MNTLSTDIVPYLELMTEVDIRDTATAPLFEEVIMEIVRLMGRQQSGRFRPSAPATEYSKEFEKTPRDLVLEALSANHSFAAHVQKGSINVTGLGSLGNLIRMDFARLLGLNIMDGSSLSENGDRYPEFVGSVLTTDSAVLSLLPFRTDGEKGLTSTAATPAYTPHQQYQLKETLLPKNALHLMRGDHKESIALVIPNDHVNKISHDVLNRIVAVLLNRPGKPLFSGKKTDYTFEDMNEFVQARVSLHSLNKNVAVIST